MFSLIFQTIYVLQLITKQRSNLSQPCCIHQLHEAQCVAFINGGSRHAQCMLHSITMGNSDWLIPINSSVTRTLTVEIGEHFELEFGLRTLHCTYGLAQLYGCCVVNILCELWIFVWTINLCQLDWTFSHMLNHLGRVKTTSEESISPIITHAFWSEAEKWNRI